MASTSSLFSLNKNYNASTPSDLSTISSLDINDTADRTVKLAAYNESVAKTREGLAHNKNYVAPLKEFYVTMKDIRLSGLLKAAFEADSAALELFVDTSTGKLKDTDIPANVVADVVAYLQHHNGTVQGETFANLTIDDEKPSTSEEKSGLLRPKVTSDGSMATIVADKWDADFIDGIWNDYDAPAGSGHQRLYNLLSEANHLEILPLVFLASARIATALKGQPLQNVEGILAGTIQPVYASTAAKTASESQSSSSSSSS
jgi:hypothetical protein